MPIHTCKDMYVFILLNSFYSLLFQRVMGEIHDANTCPIMTSVMIAFSMERSCRSCKKYPLACLAKKRIWNALVVCLHRDRRQLVSNDSKDKCMW